MVITTPRLGLPKTQGTDNARDYATGSISGGGLWRALEILDNALLTSSSLELDNPVLNDPTVTGSWAGAQHTHASADQAGATLGPGTTLSSPAFAGVISTGAQFASHVGVGVAPAAWHANARALQVGMAGALMADAGDGGTARLLFNTYLDAAGVYRAASTGTHPAARVELADTGATLWTAPGAASGAAQTFTTRLAVAQTGTVTLTPDAGLAALQWVGGNARLTTYGPTPAVETAGGHNLVLNPSGGAVHPPEDGYHSVGNSSRKWGSIWAVTGSIQTSSADRKEAITPLDPAAALAAVLATDPVTFTYTAPTPTEQTYALPDDPEDAERVLYDRLVNGPLMEAARSQAGFVLQDATGQYQTDPLFETGAGQSNAANSVGVVIAALHAIDARLSALETP